MADANIIVKIVDQTRGGLNSVVTQTDKAGAAAGRANTAFVGMGKAVAAVAAAVSVDAFLKFGDSVQNIQNRLALINPTLGDTAENFQAVLDIANRTFQPLDAVAGLYQKVARSADQYGLSAQQVSTVTESFTNLLRLAGADAGTAAGAITQFAQALGSGTLRGDELNSVIEATAGEILPLLAEELGVSVGQVREMAQEGKITGDILLNALGGGAAETAAKVDNMSVTIGGAITTLKNNFLALGTEATPVFNAIAEGILLLANNLDTVVVAVGTFVAAFAAAKLAAIVTSIGSITTAMTLLNAAIKANPFVAVASAITAAAVLVYEHFDKIREVFVGIWPEMQKAYLNFENAFFKAIENAINSVVNGFQNMGIKIGGFFKGIAAAAMDPLNAMDAFTKAMEEAEAQVKLNVDKAVDFSDAIADNDRKIVELTRDTKTNTTSTDKNTGSREDNTDATGEASEATEGWTDVTDQNTDTVDKNTNALASQYKALAESRLASERATRAVEDSIAALNGETKLLELNQDERDELLGLIELENQKRQELGDDIEDLTADEMDQLYDLAGTRDSVHLDFMTLTEEEINAYYDAQEAHRKKVESIKADLAAKRKAEREALEAERKQQRERDSLTRDIESSIKRYREDTLGKSKIMQEELDRFIKEARNQGRLNDEEVQLAIKAKRKEINDQIQDEYEDFINEQERATREFKDEFGLIYDDIYDGIYKLFGIDGKARKDIEKYNQYAKLFLGTDILGAVDNFITGSLMGMSGKFVPGMQQEGMNAGNAIATPFNPGGVAYNGIGGFIQNAIYAIGGGGGFGGGLIGAVIALFNTGLGGSLKKIFKNVFDWTKGIFGNVGNFLGDIWGGIKNVGGSIFGGIGDFFGGIVSGIGDFFSGLFADGGYIRPGTVGIVGEAGAELVRGPANVTSAEDTANMMMGGGPINVNFNINAVDAKGVDQLLIERKALIADVVRNAVQTSGRRL